MKLFTTIIIGLMSLTLSAQDFNPALKKGIMQLEKEEEQITSDRKKVLRELAEEIARQMGDGEIAALNFVCTHNSRRSQLAELWLRAAARYHGLDNIISFSGGTESTAFNHRMVDAVVGFGFLLEQSNDESNPIYLARLHPDDDPVKMFSKKYNDPFNPKEDFIAVMVCSQADRECPLVIGADARISLPFEDPKYADDTPKEQEAYRLKVREIGREILFVTNQVKTIVQ